MVSSRRRSARGAVTPSVSSLPPISTLSVSRSSSADDSTVDKSEVPFASFSRKRSFGDDDSDSDESQGTDVPISKCTRLLSSPDHRPLVLCPPKIPVPIPFPDVISVQKYDSLLISNSLKDWIAAAVEQGLITDLTKVRLFRAHFFLCLLSRSARPVGLTRIHLSV